MLRKIVILAALAALAAGTATAGMLPSWGIKAGANFSNIDTDDLTSSSRTGFVGGVFANLAWPVVNLQPELLYSQKGFNDAGAPGDAPDDKADVTVGTIQIPVLVKFALPIPAVSPSVYVGPALSFTTSATAKAATGDEDVKDLFESSAWSVVFGIDVTLSGRFMIDLRYDLGLSNIGTNALTDVGSDVKGRTFSAFLGYKF
jgi:hypothetical protein